MPSPYVIKGKIWEDSGAIVMAYVVGNDGAAITQASIASATYTVRNINTGVQVVPSTALTVADVVFNSNQTGAIWTEDSTGYRFKHTVYLDGSSAAIFTEGETKYIVEYILVPAVAGPPIFIVAEISTKSIYRS
jgi:hypothetical protein